MRQDIKKLNEESLKNNLALKSGIVYLIAELITRGISFFVTPIFTRLLPTSVYADVKIFESWAYLFAPIISLSLYQSVARAKFDFKNNYSSYISSIIGLMSLISLAVGALLFPFRSPISNLLGFSKWMMLLMLLYCCLLYTSCIAMRKGPLKI